MDEKSKSGSSSHHGALSSPVVSPHVILAALTPNAPLLAHIISAVLPPTSPLHQKSERKTLKTLKALDHPNLVNVKDVYLVGIKEPEPTGEDTERKVEEAATAQGNPAADDGTAKAGADSDAYLLFITEDIATPLKKYIVCVL